MGSGLPCKSNSFGVHFYKWPKIGSIMDIPNRDVLNWIHEQIEG